MYWYKLIAATSWYLTWSFSPINYLCQNQSDLLQSSSLNWFRTELIVEPTCNSPSAPKKVNTTHTNTFSHDSYDYYYSVFHPRSYIHRTRPPKKISTKHQIFRNNVIYNRSLAWTNTLIIVLMWFIFHNVSWHVTDFCKRSHRLSLACLCLQL